MFKVGDLALLPDGRVSEVISADPNSTAVQTADGVYAEDDLHQGHPTVLATANPSEKGSVTPLPEYVPRTYSLELQDKLESILKKMDVDVMGHWRSGSDMIAPAPSGKATGPIPGMSASAVCVAMLSLRG